MPLNQVMRGSGGAAAAAADPSPDYVEYPDGAPPELVREMKESDDTLVDSRI